MVDEFLYVRWDCYATEALVGAVMNFNAYIDTGIIVWMGSIGQ